MIRLADMKSTICNNRAEAQGGGGAAAFVSWQLRPRRGRFLAGRRLNDLLIRNEMWFKPVVDQISACAALPAASERC